LAQTAGLLANLQLPACPAPEIVPDLTDFCDAGGAAINHSGKRFI
jgi:hypothetical protein